MRIDIFPRVVHARKKETLTLFVSEKIKKETSVKIKIQPMEHYSIPHKEYRIDEDGRYPYLDTERLPNGNFATEYEFGAEQKYSLCVKIGDREVGSTYLYAIEEDLLPLRPFKGDTHIHTNRSDGEGEPFDIACEYRREGFDFIAITDHQKMEPSLECKNKIAGLTKHFFAFRGEEVHNKPMGYFHIVNFAGKESVSEIMDTQPEYVDEEVSRIIAETKMPSGVDKRSAAYRIFIANEIKRGGGVAVLSHPFWDAYGEYNVPLTENIFLMKSGAFDAVELFAANDSTGSGDNIMAALWSEVRASGVSIAPLGASDAHCVLSGKDLFAKRYSIAFADSPAQIPNAIRDKKTVAVSVFGDGSFFCFGEFRLVKYARFLLEEYYPCYKKLTEKHASALKGAQKSGDRGSLCAVEIKIDEFLASFFAN